MSGSRRTLLRRVVAGSVLVAAVAALVAEWHRVEDHLDEVSVAALAAALLPALAATSASMLAWRALLADLGSALPLSGAVRVFFLGQLGKYLPGSVWPVVTQMELGRRFSVPRIRSATAAVVVMVVGVVTGIAVALVTLPVVARDEARRYVWLAAALPLLVAVLHPRVLGPLLDRALRLVRRPPLEHAPSWRGMLGAAGWMLVAWLCFGLHVWVLALDLGGGGARLLPLSIGAFAAAWSAGFLFVVAPAGAGVREAGLVVFLGGAIGGPAATLLALASRLLLTLTDLLCAGAALATARGTPLPAVTRDTPGRLGPPDGDVT